MNVLQQRPSDDMFTALRLCDGCYFQSLVLKLELSVHRLIYISLHLQRLQHQDDSDVKAQQGAVALCYMNMLSVLVEDFGRF